MRVIYVEKDIPKVLLVKALSRCWKGVIWSRLAPFKDEVIPEPALPAPDWIRVRNIQCGVCATDLTFLNMKPSPRVSVFAVPGNQHLYLGHESVGEVVEIGPGVERFEVGQRVVLESKPFGSPNCLTQAIRPTCEYCANGQPRLCENKSLGVGPEGVGGGWGTGYIAHESEVWSVPDSLSDDQASMVEPFAVALHAILRCEPSKTDKVLIIGAGIIGLLSLKCVKTISPETRVTIVARYPHQIEAAHRFGADEIVSGDDIYERLASISDAKHYRGLLNNEMMIGGFEIVYDCVGSAKSITDGLRWTAAQGSLVLVGTTLEMMTIDISPVYYQEIDLVGSLTFGYEQWKGNQIHTFDLVIDMLQEGRLDIDGLITHRFPFEEYRKAIDTASDKRTGSIKVTLTY